MCLKKQKYVSIILIMLLERLDFHFSGVHAFCVMFFHFRNNLELCVKLHFLFYVLQSFFNCLKVKESESKRQRIDH